MVDWLYSLHDFLTFFDMDDLINDYDVTTVSGLIMTELGNIPKIGEVLIWNKLRLEVVAMDGVKITTVAIRPITDQDVSQRPSAL
jgi:putative hemolysin